MARARSFLDERREALAASDAPFNGIAALEVDPADQTRLTVLFVKPLPGEDGGVPEADPLDRFDLEIFGGDRVRGIDVLEAESDGNALSLRVSEPGDFSIYTLAVSEDRAGFDPILRSIDFSFKVGCPTDFDCEDAPARPEDPRAEPRLDHLARDYESFRRTILDRMATLVPDWTDRNPADLGVTLVELLAHVGDGLSYRLDMVETEAYLETARLRTSAARHARLVGYEMHHGVSARALVQVRLAEGVASSDVPKGAMAFATRTRALPAARSAPELAPRAVAAGAAIFEPSHDARLVRANEVLHFHDWGDAGAVLPRGATSAWLRDPGAEADLRAGDILVLVQRRDPATGREADADPEARRAVRLIADPEELADPLEPTVDRGDGPEPLRILRVEWAAEDAPGFDLAIGRTVEEPQMAEALGSIVVADHGYTLPEPEYLGAAQGLADPELPPAPGEPDEPKSLAELDRPRAFAPKLARRDLTFAPPPYEPEAPGSAAALMRLDPAQARPAISLRSSETLPIPDDGDEWLPEASLLNAAESTRAFVAEVEADGTTRLRFGDDRRGRRPEAGEHFNARYRVGTGAAGNVGAGAIAHALTDRGEIASVSNPLPAGGGRRRETIAEVRRRAPGGLPRAEAGGDAGGLRDAADHARGRAAGAGAQALAGKLVGDLPHRGPRRGRRGGRGMARRAAGLSGAVPDDGPRPRHRRADLRAARRRAEALRRAGSLRGERARGRRGRVLGGADRGRTARLLPSRRGYLRRRGVPVADLRARAVGGGRGRRPRRPLPPRLGRRRGSGERGSELRPPRDPGAVERPEPARRRRADHRDGGREMTGRPIPGGRGAPRSPSRGSAPCGMEAAR